MQVFHGLQTFSIYSTVKLPVRDHHGSGKRGLPQNLQAGNETEHPLGGALFPHILCRSKKGLTNLRSGGNILN